MKIASLLLLILAVSVSASAQKVELAPLPIKSSTFVADLLAFKAANPKMPTAELVDTANQLLDKRGMNYSLSLDAATCAKVLEIKQKQKDPSAPVRLNGALKSVDGERVQLALPDAKFTSTECGSCFLEIPVLQITKTDFISIVLERNIRFELPGNFSPVKAVLLDEKDQRTVKRTWYLPERLLPIGVSHDENVLYVAFKEPALADLSLAIFTEGTFQIASRAEADEGGKGERLQSISATSYVKFIRWRKTFIVGYSSPCPN